MHRHDPRLVLPLEERERDLLEKEDWYKRMAVAVGAEGESGGGGGSRIRRFTRWANRLDCTAGAWALSSPSTVRSVHGLRLGEEGERRGINWLRKCLPACLPACRAWGGGVDVGFVMRYSRV